MDVRGRDASRYRAVVGLDLNYALGFGEPDLGEMPQLRSLAGEWEVIRWQLRFLESLETLVTWRFDEDNLLALNEHVGCSA